MKKSNFNKNWLFTYGSNIEAFCNFGFGKYSEATGPAASVYDYSNWERIDLPHDFAVSLPKSHKANTMAGGRPVSHFARFYTEERTGLQDSEIENIGWYRKTFTVGEHMRGRRVFVEFEGVFRDSTVWVNGVYIDRHTSGYTGFIYEISDHLIFGEENSIAVRVDSDQPEGWWYEGAGIYRNVYMWVGESLYIKHESVTVKSSVEGNVRASCVIVNDTEVEVTECPTFKITDSCGNQVASVERRVTIPAYSECEVVAELKIDSPRLWDLTDPHLYTLTVSATDEAEEKFGIREAIFDPERGFLLNGNPVKIRGACVHQDLGGVGIALTDNLNRYKIAKLKEMGVNAYRASHNPPSPALLRACDELGMLVMDEVRMFGTSPEALRQMESLVRRDKNHPSVVIWCIGNEEFSVHNSEWSYRLAEKAQRLLKRLDDTRPVTYGGCNGGNFTGANGAVEVRGINYIHNGPDGTWIDRYHNNHPTQPIVGTEETSYVLSRGGTVNDLGSSMLDCTADVTMMWASTPKGWVKYMEKRPYFSGAFMWTGFDYRGEPNPFVYTNFSSSFGTIDLSGMPKPPFYYYKSWWTDETVLKLTPHWNYKTGETASIIIYTNCDEVTLYLNDKEIGKYCVEYLDDIRVKIPFEEGTLRAVGIRNSVEYTDSLTTHKETVKIKSRVELACEGDEDISIVELTGIDGCGSICATASDMLEVEMPEGEGEIVGVCNGDPKDTYCEKPAFFEKSLLVKAFNKDGKLFCVPDKAQNERKSRIDYIEYRPNEKGYDDDYRIVAIFKDEECERHTEIYTTTLTDVEDYEYIELERFGTVCEVYLNGELIGSNKRAPRNPSTRYTRPYRFYANFKNGENTLEIRAIRELVGAPAFSGYVKLGKRVASPIRIPLHYGKARVFLKSAHPEDLVAKIVK